MTDMKGDADIAGVAALLADPGRARVLIALADGRALPAGRLADEAGMSASSASSHLAKLVAGGLLSVQNSGRHRYYRLSGPEVAHVIEALARIAPSTEIRSLRQGTRANALRRARTCYDHLAGQLGVAVMAALIDREILIPEGSFGATMRRECDPIAAPLPDNPYRLGPEAHSGLASLGVDLTALLADASRRPLLRFCMDWTEERHHLAGRLGASITHEWIERGWLRQVAGQRAVRVTPDGTEALSQGLDIAPAP